jgi:hypothetical protein
MLLRLTDEFRELQAGDDIDTAPDTGIRLTR